MFQFLRFLTLSDQRIRRVTYAPGDIGTELTKGDGEKQQMGEECGETEGRKEAGENCYGLFKKKNSMV
jgi:hypothetical protein